MLFHYQVKNLQQKGLTIQQIALAHHVNERTIYRWIKHTWKPKQKKGRKLKLTSEALKTFLDYVAKNNTLTQQEMANHASQLVGQPITRFIVSRALKQHGLIRKKLTYHYSEQDKKKIEQFQATVKPLLALPIYALDECSFHLGEVPRYGYSKIGSRANFQRTGKKSSNYTLLLCVANKKEKGVVLYQIIEGGVNAQIFHNFLTHLKSLSDKNYLIMDNVRIHHANQACHKLGLTSIRELLASKNIEPLYLPPYTPEMNPVELCFNFIRQQVEKSKPITYEELKLAISKAVNILHQKDLTEYFWHCWSYFPYKKGELVYVSKSDLLLMRKLMP